MDIKFKIAEPEQADVISEIITETSGGIVDYLLHDLVPGYSPSELLSSAVISQDNSYSYQNVVMAMSGYEPAGLVLTYPWDKHYLPHSARNFFIKKRLETFKGILNSLEVESLHINTLWVSEDFRGTGLADSFIDLTASLALEYNLYWLSLHVWADNQRAIKFYKRHGFIQTKHIPIKTHPLLPHQGGKLLMQKELG